MKRWLKHLFIPFALIDTALPKAGLIVDIGCGEGTVTLFLSQRPKRRLIGIDRDATRLHLAKVEAKGKKNVRFIKADLLKLSLPKNLSGCVIADVIHHLPRSFHAKLLNTVVRNLKPGGVLVIKEIVTDDVLRSKLSRLWDFILYPKDTIYYRSLKDYTAMLKKTGCQVTHQRTNHLTPASIHLFKATKK
ncbi:MAG: class I SAM-dependent methyltransferase [Candidatus Chisholmbacteria bacterium]|nr:class I SAM-dependent methyltransferase [Candidatus Chisholmbacteria bacterium]